VVAARSLKSRHESGCGVVLGLLLIRAKPNPGPLKGCVPSWEGGDFPELVQESTDVDHCEGE
jgi:hypothetical protein